MTIHGHISFECPVCRDGDVELTAEVGSDRSVGIGNHLVDVEVSSECTGCGFSPKGDVFDSIVDAKADDLIDAAIDAQYPSY